MEIRSELGTASPYVMMKALQIYCHDAYGCMLWDLGSSEAESFFKCWNTNVKLINGLPRNTYTYLVEGHFAKHFVSLRNQVFMRYAGFFRSLLNSPSKEVQMLARLVRNDPRSITYKNLRLVKQKTKLELPFAYGKARLLSSLPIQSVPDGEKWRLGLLDYLLFIRDDRAVRGIDASDITAMIQSLCNT